MDLGCEFVFHQGNDPEIFFPVVQKELLIKLIDTLYLTLVSFSTHLSLTLCHDACS